MTGVIEGMIETSKAKSAFAGFSYAIDENSSIMLKYAIQEKEDVVNNIIGAQIRIMF
jgi:hypothetical protein